MVYAQLGGIGSLRELEKGFNQHRSHHYHLNTRDVHRTTLADANKKRNPQIFAETLQALIQVGTRNIRRETQELLLLLDSTSIALRGRGSQWTAASATRTPGLKLHLLFSSGQQLPVHQTITAANVNDVQEGRKLEPVRGATYVFDKGYCDYAWWNRIDAGGARFVTRLKSNAAVTVVCTRQVPSLDAGQILGDEVVRFTHRSNRGGHRNTYDGLLRRIEVARPGEPPLVLVTNDLSAPAAEIAQIYRQRWQIELFFKWIKQHLRIKRFLGENENAIRIQILTALIAYLLVAILNEHARHPDLWTALAELRTGLFHRPKQDESWWRRKRQAQELQAALQPGLFG